MSEVKKVIGIVSWMPDNLQERKVRFKCFNNLLKQINQYFPDIPLMIIAQNWNSVEPTILNEATIYKYNIRLGIIGARVELAKKFLNDSDADYIIMFDDDCVIKCTEPNANIKYIEAINNNPNGFAFLKGNSDDGANGSPNPYKDSCLNLCAISRDIMVKTPMPIIDPEQSQAFEDRIWSMLLHKKHANVEFNIPDCITTAHFHDPNVPSTWSRRKPHNWRALRANTLVIEQYIEKYGEMPKLQ